MAAVIVLIFLSTVRRMLDLQKIPPFMWPVLLLAGAMPSFMAYTVLNPGRCSTRRRCVHRRIPSSSRFLPTESMPDGDGAAWAGG